MVFMRSDDLVGTFLVRGMSVHGVRRLITRFFPRQFFMAYHRQQRSVASWLQGRGGYTLSFDVDYEADVRAVPEVLGILKHYGIQAGFACIGMWIERFPNVHRRIISEGHELLNHTYSHPDNEELNPDQCFNLLSNEEQTAEITQCHTVALDLLSYEMRGFRTPHFARLHTESVYQILSSLGYIYSCSTISVDTRNWGLPVVRDDGLIEIPMGCAPDHPFTIFDSWSCQTSLHPLYENAERFLLAFYEIIDVLLRTKAYTTHYFDPADVVRDGKLERMCSYLAEKRQRDGLWLPLYHELVTELTDRQWR